MPTLHQESQNKAVLGKIKEVLEQRIGSDRFRLWFGDRVRFGIDGQAVSLEVDGDFALERLRGKYLREVEAAAAQVTGRIVPVRMSLLAETTPVLSSDSGSVAAGSEDAAEVDASFPAIAPLRDAALPSASVRVRRVAASQPTRLTSDAQPTRSIRVTEQSPAAAAPVGTTRGPLASERPRVRSVPAATPRRASDSNGNAAEPGGAGNPAGSSGRRVVPMTFGSFLQATSNTLAITAAKLLAAEPVGSSPLCFWGATGTGKTHLLHSIRHELRARHGLSRVILLSAEQFTNDFLSCVRGTGLPAFRKRYRDADALLVDNVQFLGGKTATLREMMYTVDAVVSRGRPLVMAADRQPMEIDGLGSDLAGRLSSGLVCGINPMERELRRDLYRCHAQHSFLPWDEPTIEMLADRTIGDGRVIQGVSQLVSMLQRMYRRMPTFQEITSQAGEMLQRGPKVVALADVERAICATFGISTQELRSDAKSRNVSHPRILAMYLSREHTTAAFSEIGRYYGDRNHSTVIAAHRRVEQWLEGDRPLGGRGPKNMKVQEAIAAVENLLRIG